ncbi:hypothetical protein ACFW4K_12075 [Nocardiopsis alba]|uniref:hypothetical protein n=1 Tax=Nocardiopsis alba TaxID=53437 RepID=UPI00366AAB6F
MNETPRKRREDGHGPIAWITRWKVALAVAAALSLIVGIGVFTLLPRDHEHFTSDGEPEVGDVPREVDHIAWEWDTPDGTTIQEVAPGPAGPIALTDHGAIALDGTTGEELWGITTTDPDIHTLSGVTPDGERTVIFQIRRLDEGALNKVTILDSRTGKIDHRFDHQIEGDTSERSFTWKDPDPDPRALSDHTWPESTETGLLAHDLSDGGVAWDYTPPDGCTIRSQAYAVNLAPYTIASTGDLFVFPEHCGLPEEQDSHETAVESTGRIVALDAATGEPAWPAITDIVFRRDSGSDNLGFRTPITLDTEQTSVLAHTTSGPTSSTWRPGNPGTNDSENSPTRNTVDRRSPIWNPNGSPWSRRAPPTRAPSRSAVSIWNRTGSPTRPACKDSGSFQAPSTAIGGSRTAVEPPSPWRTGCSSVPVRRPAVRACPFSPSSPPGTGTERRSPSRCPCSAG